MSIPIVLLAAVSCIPYYYKYEKKKPQTREHVVLAVMTALTVISRMIFAPVPGFKPVAAMVMICGMAFGRESGFLCGSLSAFVSNFFFGQGPWTPRMVFRHVKSNGTDGKEKDTDSGIWNPCRNLVFFGHESVGCDRSGRGP